MKMVYADSTLTRMTKRELVEQIRCLEHNLRNAEKINDRQYFYLTELCDKYDVSSEEIEELVNKYIRKSIDVERKQ